MSGNDVQPRAPQSTDLLAGAFFFAWAIVGWSALATNEALIDSLGAGADPGPALMPFISLVVLTLGGLGICCNALLRMRHARLCQPLRWTDHTLPVAYALSVVLATAVMIHIGFIAAGFGLSFCWLYVLSDRLRSFFWSVTRAVGLAAAITATVYIMFAHFLLVPLP